MRIKKACARVYGADLTAVEKKATDLKIQRQLVEHTRKHQAEFDAMILRELHVQLG